MRNILNVLILIGGIFLFNFVQVESEGFLWEENWVVTWGGKDYDDARRMLIDRDHIYITGRTVSFENKHSNVFLLKYNLEGKLLWNVTWDSPSYDWPKEFAVHNDSIYITGVTINPEENWDVLLLKFNTEGKLLWNNSWGGIGWEGSFGKDEGYDVEAIGDYIYVLGTTNSDAGRLNEQDFLLLKYDFEGELVWHKNYGQSQTFEYGRCLEFDGDKLYVAGHFLDVSESAERNSGVLLSKLDIDGNLDWNVSIGEGLSSVSVFDMLMEEQSIYVSGEWSSHNDGSELFVLGFDNGGELQWSDTWIVDDSQSGMDVFEDQLFVIGQTMRLDPKNSEVFVYGYNSNGLLQYNSTWRRDANETGLDILLVEDTLYILGQTSSKGQTNIFIASFQNPFLGQQKSFSSDNISGFSLEYISLGIILGMMLILFEQHSRIQKII